MRIILGALLGVYGTMVAYGDVNPASQFEAATAWVATAIAYVVQVGGAW